MIEMISLAVLATCYFPDAYCYNSLYNLANALHLHFGRTDSMTDLDEAILLHRESLSFCPSPHPRRLESLICLAWVLRDCFGKTDSMTNLEEAISMLREALSLDPAATHPHRLLALDFLWMLGL